MPIRMGSGRTITLPKDGSLNRLLSCGPLTKNPALTVAGLQPILKVSPILCRSTPNGWFCIRIRCDSCSSTTKRCLLDAYWRFLWGCRTESAMKSCHCSQPRAAMQSILPLVHHARNREMNARTHLTVRMMLKPYPNGECPKKRTSW